MIALLISCLIGIGAGYVSMKAPKLFIGFLFAIPPAAFGLLKLLSVFASPMASAGVGNGGLFSMVGAMFGRLPEDVQTAVIFLPAFTIVARLVFWIYKTYLKSEPAAEDKAERRKRILASYGMSS